MTSKNGTAAATGTAPAERDHEDEDGVRTEVPIDSAVGEELDMATSRGRERSTRAVALSATALAVLLVLAVGGTLWVYVNWLRPEQQTDSAVAQTVLAAATTGTVAMLSYAPETLDADFATAKTHLTGDFLNYYSQFTSQIVATAAKDKSVKTSAVVTRSAVVDLQPRAATVLVFINQTTTSKDNVDPAMTASSVKVGLRQINDAWLISAFDPV